MAVVGALVALLLGSGLVAASVVNTAPQAVVEGRLRTIGLAGTVEGEAEPPAPTTSTAVVVPHVGPSTTTQPTTIQTSTTLQGDRATSTTTPVPPKRSTTTVAQTTTWTTPPTVPLPPIPFTGPTGPANNGTGRWSTVSNGISVDLRMDPVAPKAGENVHFSISASYPTEYCCLTAFYLGDGTFVPPPMDDNPCPAAHPSVFTEQVDHVYARAGTFSVEVQPSSFSFCAPGAPVVVNAQLYVTIVVAPPA